MKQHQVEWDERVGPAVNARRHLPKVLKDYFRHVRRLLDKNPAPTKLHQLRLVSKRLRYTLELFRPCYGPGLETRMTELRQLQQLLGEMNDSAVTAGLVTEAMKKSAQRTQLVKFLEERAEKKADEFRRQWAEVFDAPGRERWWTGYLAREARAPGRTR